MQLLPRTAPIGLYLFTALVLSGCGIWPRSNPAKPDLPELADISSKRQHREQEAVLRFEQKRNDIQLAAARSRWEQGDVDGCIEQLELLLARSPDHAEALALLAEVTLAVEDVPPELEAVFDETLPDLAGCGDSGPGSPEPALFAAPSLPPQEKKISADDCLADVHRDSRVRPVDHRQPIRPAIEQLPPAFPDSQQQTPPAPRQRLMPPPGRPVASFERAEAALAQGDVTAAHGHLVRVLQTERIDAATAVSAAVLPLRHGQPELALHVATVAANRFGSSAGLFRVIGTAYYRIGDYKSSQTALQQALFLDRSNPLTYLLMSSTLAKLGNREGAGWYRQQARLLNAQRTASR
jgi:predicted Zn-dependent protease